jgi:integration host factor subunit beta
MQTITKKDLVNYISEVLAREGGSLLGEENRASRVRVTKVLVKDVVQSFLDKITEELAKGNRLEFREFGVFEVKERAARQAQNPRTLEKVQVPPKRVVKFKVGRKMREMVEKGILEEGPGGGTSPNAPGYGMGSQGEGGSMGASGL